MTFKNYDANGNLEYDKHRKIIAINYNTIDRPRQIRFEQGDAISYIYSATGEKLAEISRSADGSDSAEAVNVRISKKEGIKYDYLFNK